MYAKVSTHDSPKEHQSTPDYESDEHGETDNNIMVTHTAPVASSDLTFSYAPGKESTQICSPTTRNLKLRPGTKNKRFCRLFATSVAFITLVIAILWLCGTFNSKSTYTSFGAEIHTVAPTSFPMSFQHPKEKMHTHCSTSTCRDAANNILEAMDQEVDPCTDFYQYACGGWIKNNPIPEGLTSWENFQILQIKNLFVMKRVLEDGSRAQSTAEEKACNYYKSCLDTDGIIEKLGSAPILELLNKIGGWNIIGNFDAEEWDFQQTLQIMHNLLPANKLFSWMVVEDLKNSSETIIELDQGTLGLRSRDFYVSPDVATLATYLRYMTEVGTLLGGNEDATRDQMVDVIMFEVKLAKIMIPDESKKNLHLIYNKMNISELMKLAPAIDWFQYFNYAFQRVDRRILPSDDIIVSVPSFMHDMSKLLTEYLSTGDGKTVLNNYFGWSLLQGMVSFLPKSFQIRSTVIEETIAGSNEDKSWPLCLLKTDTVIGFALGAMFVRETFPSDIRPTVEEMINEIRVSFVENLPLLKWLDNDTRKLIKEKMEAIGVMVGFPPFSIESRKLDKYYEGLVFRRNEYFYNTLRARDFNLLKNMKKLKKPVDQNKWMLTPPTVNAYYSPLKNQIVVPAGILQKPFYNQRYPRSISFGRFGSLIGHELMHALDNQGRLFDKLGNLHPWWKNSTIQRFEERAQCFVDQYSAYNENGVYLDGKKILPDNIADNGGLKAAFRAYESWVRKHSKELSLPGISLSHKQLFFVSFAQMWCSAITSEAMKEGMRKWTHSPHKYRVIGTISNSADFAKEFGCRKRISRRKKCELW